MVAAEREIVDLLKESTENKINAKTTWNSTLIDEFSNIEKFKEKDTNSINFQHASIVLDGCVKVYSTRVDSVVSEADKLMDSVGRAKEPNKQKIRAKAHPTIEPNSEAILIKQKLASADDEILEYLARESKEGDTRGLLMHLLKWSDTKGFHVLQSCKRAEESTDSLTAYAQEISTSMPIKSVVDFHALRESLCTEGKKKSISPMFSSFTPDKSVEELVLPMYAYNISYDAEPLEYTYKREDVVFAEPEFYCDAVEESFQNNEFSEVKEGVKKAKEHCGPVTRLNKKELHLICTPFGYVKGWAGPSHWKVHAKKQKKEKSEAKERKKAKIDFLTDVHLPISTLFEKGEGIVMTSQQISERRKNSNILPPDHNVQIEDLYRMFVYPGSLYAIGEKKVSNEKQDNQETSLSSDEQPHTDWIELEDNLYTGVCENKKVYQNSSAEAVEATPEKNALPQTTLLSRRLLQSALRKARRNDIVKVKESLWSKIEEGERKVETIYSAIEEQKISVHFYLVSLLHLANERNLQITSDSKKHLSEISDLSLTAL